MLTNVRMPDQNHGDLQAQIAAMNTGERKVHDMVRKFGVDVFRQGVKDLLDLGERQARACSRRIPDGDYFFADYLDEDAPGGVPVRLALTLQDPRRRGRSSTSPAPTPSCNRRSTCRPAAPSATSC